MWRKLDIPIFGGDVVFGWTNRLERYFHLQEVSEMERMQTVMIALEGKALQSHLGIIQIGSGLSLPVQHVEESFRGGYCLNSDWFGWGLC
ncbi:hypothetical protein LR48_Vigan04g203100 [Vigna angularis]|uniref:Uncharacterized protein n=1 Tax=Phaseolus angularis TaxID=3914 RepID=A0A0L9UGF0_PHAAN|nr:hypothetical protein LR48_Vigan04g203100 [Vigna angularis]